MSLLLDTQGLILSPWKQSWRNFRITCLLLLMSKSKPRGFVTFPRIAERVRGKKWSRTHHPRGLFLFNPVPVLDVLWHFCRSSPMPSLITSDVVESSMSWIIEGRQGSSYLCRTYTSEKETESRVLGRQRNSRRWFTILSIHSDFERVGIGLDFKAQAGLFPHPSLRENTTYNSYSFPSGASRSVLGHLHISFSLWYRLAVLFTYHCWNRQCMLAEP